MKIFGQFLGIFKNKLKFYGEYMVGNKVLIQQTKQGQYFITLPTAIVKLKGWDKGTLVELTEDRFHDILLREAPK